MAISLRSVLGEPSAIKKGGFAGAIFTTYTLNLGFFEQLIIPKLDEARCSNVLVFADPDGYEGALTMRGTGVWGVGQKYLCVPVKRPSGGVQHTKLALLAGAKHGRLLLGSGNLTLNGYGRNLELYSHFEYDLDESAQGELYPFIIVWDFLKRLAEDGRLTAFAEQQMDTIQHSARWLEEQVAQPIDFRVWHNYEHSIWDQLMEWREQSGLRGMPGEVVQIISPYYDKDGKALTAVAQDLKVKQVDLYLNKDSTNFDGKAISKTWQEQESKLMVKELHVEGGKNKFIRPLHAKAIIAKENGGVWCISGSSNATVPGLIRSWLHGGNLEMVTFQWSADPSAFDYLLSDPSLKIAPLRIEDVAVTEPEPSEQPQQSVTTIVIQEAVVRGKLLEGTVSHLPSDCPDSGTIIFLRSDIRIDVNLKGNNFTVQLPEIVKEAEAIQLSLGRYVTPFRWLDHPDLLLKQGSRSYHGRVRSQLETIDGTEKLFIELMNFLRQRVEISNVSADDRPIRSTHVKDHGTNKPEDLEPDETLTPDMFVVPESEVVNRLSKHLEHYLPYDQSLWGLRDLLSIALLRLTIPVTPDDPSKDFENKPKGSQQESELIEIRQIKALERLRHYLLDYCKRYGQRLVNTEFVTNTGAALLFENHVTLERVLLNFFSTVDEFSQADLAHCMLWIWAPLVLPKILGLDGKPTFEMLMGSEDLSSVWANSGMASYAVAAFVTSFGNPPQWQSGVWDDKLVQKYLAIRDILCKVESLIGKTAFSSDPDDLQEAYGIHSLASLENLNVAIDRQIDLVEKRFDSLKDYRPPAEEKYSEFLELQNLRKGGLLESPQSIELQKAIALKGYEKELKEFIENKRPILPAIGDDDYCPRCGGRLTGRLSSELKRGALVLCSVSQDALIYRVPETPKSISL